MPAAASRARTREPRGVPVESGGETWFLPALPLRPELDGERDELYDDATIGGSVSRTSVFALGLLMLRANYRLENDEAAAILLGAPRRELVEAVVANVLLDELPRIRRNYSYWARSGLVAAGLDPDKVPAELLGGVIKHLLATGRMAPPEAMTEAGRFANVKGELEDLI